MLEFDHCHIGRKRVLYSIDHLSLTGGQLVALIGANGTGKSTFLQAFSQGAFLAGTVFFDKRDWHKIIPGERAKLVAFIDNKFSGYDHLSTREYLELGRFPHTGFSGRLSEHDRQVVATYAEEMCVEHLLDQATSTLSDGERQRAGIARALIQETPIVLLDEPTSFLDYPTKRSVMLLLQQIAHKHNKLIVLASHDLELCLEFVSDLLIIDPRKKVLNAFPSNLSLETLVELAFRMSQ